MINNCMLYDYQKEIFNELMTSVVVLSPSQTLKKLFAIHVTPSVRSEVT